MTDLNPTEIGNFISQLRKDKKMTQAELGDKLGVTNKTVSRWENGNYLPDISTMQLLCAEFDISINEFLKGERIHEDELKKIADENIFFSLKRIEKLKKEKKISDMLGGAGTGLLVSTLYSPDSIKKSITFVVGVIMILVSWYLKSKMDNYFLGK